MENNFTFYLNFNSDNIEEAMEFKTNSDLLFGDVLEFVDHELAEEISGEFHTTRYHHSEKFFNGV
ncbi:hypothetical protein [Chryseobacterium sp. MDT2-18]|uniref:hypothetical protein n=1 Tax=Chryseobacterium sp. MDT2-18 TaxID=1259136 RepID=UPI002783FCBD|nr:hypothetical protein [Chryseobacterium sp. MDT2-18]MDQ0478274.1 hypothetical protein [Chryseobacterium sp. MDT2-18]